MSFDLFQEKFHPTISLDLLANADLGTVGYFATPQSMNVQATLAKMGALVRIWKLTTTVPAREGPQAKSE